MMTKYFIMALGVSLIGYLFGSLPTGHLVGRSLGVDISKHGSGNIGATNVLRVLGRRWGYLVFFIDTLKGFLAVRAAFCLVQIAKIGVERIELVGILAAITCILGHTFPIWLRFKGGKFVADTALLYFSVLIAGVVIWRHRSNLKRLINGTERRFSR